MSTIDERIIERQFLSSLHEAGISPKGELRIIMDGKIHRFSVEGDRCGAVSGAYTIFTDQWPHWYIQDYRQHSEMIHFTFDKNALSHDELREIFQANNNAEQRAAFQAKRITEQKNAEAARQKAIACARLEYDNAEILCVDEHPYIAERFTSRNIAVCHYAALWGFEDNLRLKPPYNALKRGIKEVKKKLVPGKLLIPITNIMTRELQSLQAISDTPDENGKFEKRFFPGTGQSAHPGSRRKGRRKQGPSSCFSGTGCRT